MNQRYFHFAALLLLAFMAVLAGGAALRESATVDEVAHVGAGLSYWQKFDLRLNPEHPPLGKMIAALPLALRGTYADYSSPSWKLSDVFFSGYMGEWIFGDAVLGRWNDWRSTLAWARGPMLLLTLWLGWMIYVYGSRIGGSAGGLLGVALFVSTPAFLVFGPLVITDVPVTLFIVIALWRMGEVWVEPSRENVLLFAYAMAAAMLSKFTGLILIGVILVFYLQTRFWPTAAEPADRADRKPWRRARLRAMLRSVLWAALIVYAVYAIFSWNQPASAVERIQGGAWAVPVRRLLMPAWLYLRGLLFFLVTAKRPTFLLGRVYSQGVPFYFPVIFALKAPLGFLALLVMGGGAAFWFRRSREAAGAGVVLESARPHWRVLILAFGVFTTICLLSPLNISIRHFTVPIALMILMLAPLPAILGRTRKPKLLLGVTAALALSSVIAVVPWYPFFFPFVNSLGMGRPVYTLMNDSNVDWNEGLPEVESFVRRKGLSRIKLDWLSLSDPAVVVPEAQAWDCQAPGDEDAGQWVVVSSVNILEFHNCGWLQQYPREALANGGMYAVRLPAPIPPAGTPGGPPAVKDRRVMFGAPFDIRAFAVNVERHPEKLEGELSKVMKAFTSAP